MAFNIAQFKSNALVRGGARPSLFKVMFPNVTNLRTVAPQTQQLGDDQMTFLCNAASIPAMKMDAIPVSYMGRPTFYPGERSFDPWTVQIINDEDFKLRDFFEAWSNQMNSLVGNLADSSDPRNYKVDNVIVQQLAKDGALIREYHFFGMWPTIVGDIVLRWDQGNAIEMFEVRLVYDFWIPAGVGSPDSEQVAPPSYDVGDLGDLQGLSSRVTL